MRVRKARRAGENSPFNELPRSKLQGIYNQTSPPLMGGEKGEGEQTFCHPHLASPIKGEELCGNPAASYRKLSIKGCKGDFFKEF
jgi:hypothetical protein